MTHRPFARYGSTHLGHGDGRRVNVSAGWNNTGRRWPILHGSTSGAAGI